MPVAQCKYSFGLQFTDGAVANVGDPISVHAVVDQEPDDSKVIWGGYIFGPNRCMIVYYDVYPRDQSTVFNISVSVTIGSKNYKTKEVLRLNAWPPGANEAPALNTDGVQVNPIRLEPSAVPFHRPQLTRGQLAAVRGAMWSTRWNGRFGPRPGQPTNILAMDYYEWYTPEERAQMRAIYSGNRGYQFAVTGPFVDDGYHGQFPAQHTVPTDVQLAHYLDCMQEWWTNESGYIVPVHFARPDNWSFEQVRDTFTEFYSDSRTRELLPVHVPTGWEPTDYGWSSRTWAMFREWMLKCNPDAIILMHPPSECDCPNGKDDHGDDSPNVPNWGRIWHTHVENLHGLLMQNGPYGYSPSRPRNDDERNTAVNFGNQFRDVNGSLYQRFHKGYAGWPTNSAWGPNTPILIINGECTAYASYWEDLPEAGAREWGDVAINSGADGYLDGGTLPVQVRR